MRLSRLFCNVKILKYEVPLNVRASKIVYVSSLSTRMDCRSVFLLLVTAA